MSASEIAHLRAQILQLESRRADLYATLLNLRSSHPLVHPTSLTSSSYTPSSTNPTTNAPTIPLETLHRLPGITLFTLSHPQEGLKLGIRFDIFSSHHGIFLEPYWVILQRPDSTDSTNNNNEDALELDWTNIPACLKPDETCAHFLSSPPSPSSSSSSSTAATKKERTKDRLTPLAHALRTTLSTYTTRREAILALVPLVGEEAVEMDDMAQVVEIRSEDGAFRLWVEGEGEVTKVVARDGEGRRRREVEKRMLGPVGGLGARMGWEATGGEGEGDGED